MSKNLKGKVALVTGASRGIGAAIAERLAEQGADVAISYSASAVKAEELAKSLQAKGVRAKAFRADQGNAAEVKTLVDEVARHFGRLDILVNNAGVFNGGKIDDPALDTAVLARQFAINVGGVAAAVQAATQYLGEGGRIINIGSVLGKATWFPGISDYSATKGAVALFTKGWARDLGPKGITVNNIQPGPIDTDMNPDSGDFAATQKAATALGRYGKPEEVAAAVAFLAGPEASFITGADLNVDGGFAA